MSVENMPVSNAEELKARGNAAYKREDFRKAASLYQQASILRPDEPIYLSNLSAAEFESGQYGDALDRATQALDIVESQHPINKNLKMKLLLRKAKALVQLNQDEEAKSVLKDLLLIDDTVPQATILLASLSRVAVPRPKVDEELVLRRLVSLPKYRPEPIEVMEYYTVGHDTATSLLAGQQSPEDNPQPWRSRFRMHIPKDNKTPFDFSALFCGIGDARHLYATLADVGVQMNTRKSKNTKLVHIHLTAIDINPSVLARDLVVLLSLEKLSTIPTEQHLTDPKSRELLVMLHYLYWATIMPPCAHRTMMSMIKHVHDALHAYKEGKTTKAFDVTWLHVEDSAIDPLLHELSWWLKDGPTCVPLAEMIQDNVAPVTALDNPNNLIPSSTLDSMKDNLQQKKQEALALLDAPAAQSDFRIRATQEGISLQEFKAKLRAGIEEAPLEEFSPDVRMSMESGYYAEYQQFKKYKILCPPEFADGEVPELRYIFRIMRLDGTESNEVGMRTMKSRRKNEVANPSDVVKVLEKHWKINCTLLNETSASDPKGRDLGFDPFSGQSQMTDSPELEHIVSRSGATVYNQSSRFFSAVAHALRIARDAIQIEVLFGDGLHIMEQIHYGLTERKTTFPSAFDRIHLSNVPDYLGGHLSMFTVAVPLLKKHPLAYVASNCLLNTLLWEGVDIEDTTHRWSKVADSYVYSYTGCLVSEIPSMFGLRLDSEPAFPGDYSTWIRTESPLLPFSRLEQVLTRIFWKTVIPAKYTTCRQPSHQRESLNVQFWFRLLAYLVDIGYPPHMLQTILEAMLENRLTSNITPHSKIPIPLSTRLSNKPKIPISTAPFITELRTSAALWSPRLGLKLLVPDLPTPEDLVRYSIVLKKVTQWQVLPIIRQHKTLLLCFGLPQDMDKDVPTIRDDLVGSFEPRNSLQILTTFEWVSRTGVATFLLPRARATEFIQKGYEVALVDHMFWRIISQVAPSSSLVEVGTVDTWDHTLPVAETTTRTVMDRDGLMEAVMGGGPGGGPGDCPIQ